MHSLDDDGFKLLGNALMLGYAAARAHREPGKASEREFQLDRTEYSERVRLRETLMVSGAYDYRIEAPEGYWNEGNQGLAERRSYLLSILSKDVEISTVRLKDFEVHEALASYFKIDEALLGADASELRLPISQIMPCPLTKAYTSMVEAYFRNKMPGALYAFLPADLATSRQFKTPPSTEFPKADPCEDAADRDKELRDQYPAESAPQATSTRGLDGTDAPFVEAGLKLALKGLSANQAAEAIVEEHGVETEDKWRLGSPKIRTRSPQNTAKRLARKINKRLKEKQ